MLQFDAATTRILDTAYAGADITCRRRASFDALAAAPGEVIADLGCGNGMLTQELARAVGPSGKVLGVDPSAEMLASATKRCAGLDQVTLLEGTCTALPIADGTVDKVVALQVLEYVEDLETACTEALRILTPGGRLVFSDMHYDLFAWHTNNAKRMASMRASWDLHFVWRDATIHLRNILEALGQEIEDMRTVNFTDHVLKPDGLAMMMMHLMRGYAVSNGHIPQDEADAWFAEQEALAAQGQFFFNMTQVVLIARKT